MTKIILYSIAFVFCMNLIALSNDNTRCPNTDLGGGEQVKTAHSEERAMNLEGLSDLSPFTNFFVSEI